MSWNPQMATLWLLPLCPATQDRGSSGWDSVSLWLQATSHDAPVNHALFSVVPRGCPLGNCVTGVRCGQEQLPGEGTSVSPPPPAKGYLGVRWLTGVAGRDAGFCTPMTTHSVLNSSLASREATVLCHLPHRGPRAVPGCCHPPSWLWHLCSLPCCLPASSACHADSPVKEVLASLPTTAQQMGLSY